MQFFQYDKKKYNWMTDTVLSPILFILELNSRWEIKVTKKN